MAVPFRRTSTSKKKKRRSHHALSLHATFICKNCGASVLSHHACKDCGYYKNKVAFKNSKNS